MGAVNVVSFAAVGYLAYANWNKPRWDRRVVAGAHSRLDSCACARECSCAGCWMQALRLVWQLC